MRKKIPFDRFYHKEPVIINLRNRYTLISISNSTVIYLDAKAADGSHREEEDDDRHVGFLLPSIEKKTNAFMG